MENIKIYEKGTIGWLKEQAKKDGFEDLSKWKKWKKSRRDIENARKERDIEIRKQESRSEYNINYGSLCNNCKKNQLLSGRSYREKNDKGELTGKVVCVICYNYRLKHGVYKNYDKYSELEEKYGKEFADWAIKKIGEIPNHILSAGCKTDKEYRDKIARDAGFKNRQDREDCNAKLLGYINISDRYGQLKIRTEEYQDELDKRREFRKTKEYRDLKAIEKGYKNDTDRKNVQRWNSGRVIPVEDYEGCESHTGCIIGEDKIGKHILDLIFEDVTKMKFNHPGYEFVCKNPKQEFLDRYPQFKLESDKDYKIDVKTAHFLDGYWKYRIDYNNLTDYFLTIGLGTIDSIPQFVLLIHKYDIIRGKKFRKRVAIKLNKKYVHEFSTYILNHELEDFKKKYINLEENND